VTHLQARPATPFRGLVLPLAAAAALLAGPPVHAQTYNLTVDSSPDLGIIVPDANSTTTFSFASSSGNVSQDGVGAVRRGGGTTRGQVTISCQCNNKIYVAIGSIGSPTGKAGALSAFEVTSAGGNSGNIQNISGTNPLTFTVTPKNKNFDASFYIGADFPIGSSAGAGSFGPATSQFYVYAGSSASPTTGTIITATATTYRGISITGSSMAFGVISKPASGTATVTMGPGSDIVDITGGSSTHSGAANRAAFTVSGEGGMAIAVTVDPSFTMNRTGGGGSFTVTTNNTTLPTLIPGSAGAGGTTSTFHVGGSFDITPGTAAGGYTGSFNVMASYN
jgi:hypothetical protein